MKKVAVCIGLNQYPDPRNNLRGCVNDALDLADYLKNVQGVTDITVLTDSKVKVSKASQFIINKIKECSSGDHFILTNSSHGSSVPDKNGDEIDGIPRATAFGLVKDGTATNFGGQRAYC